MTGRATPRRVAVMRAALAYHDDHAQGHLDGRDRAAGVTDPHGYGGIRRIVARDA